MTRFTGIAPRLPVRDLQRTVGFYTDVLGFRIGVLWPADRPTFAILERDDVSMQFCVDDRGSAEAVGHATIYIDVGDAGALHRAISGRVDVEWGPEVYWYGRREFAVRDPDGYLVILSEPTEDPPTCAER